MLRANTLSKMGAVRALLGRDLEEINDELAKTEDLLDSETYRVERRVMAHYIKQMINTLDQMVILAENSGVRK